MAIGNTCPVIETNWAEIIASVSEIVTWFVAGFGNIPKYPDGFTSPTDRNGASEK